jgi:hypothetical protein
MAFLSFSDSIILASSNIRSFRMLMKVIIKVGTQEIHYKVPYRRALPDQCPFEPSLVFVCDSKTGSSTFMLTAAIIDRPYIRCIKILLVKIPYYLH